MLWVKFVVLITIMGIDLIVTDHIWNIAFDPWCNIIICEEFHKLKWRVPSLDSIMRFLHICTSQNCTIFLLPLRSHMKTRLSFSNWGLGKFGAHNEIIEIGSYLRAKMWLNLNFEGSQLINLEFGKLQFEWIFPNKN